MIMKGEAARRVRARARKVHRVRRERRLRINPALIKLILNASREFFP